MYSVCMGTQHPSRVSLLAGINPNPSSPASTTTQQGYSTTSVSSMPAAVTIESAAWERSAAYANGHVWSGRTRPKARELSFRLHWPWLSQKRSFMRLTQHGQVPTCRPKQAKTPDKTRRSKPWHLAGSCRPHRHFLLFRDGRHAHTAKHGILKRLICFFSLSVRPVVTGNPS